MWFCKATLAAVGNGLWRDKKEQGAWQELLWVSRELVVWTRVQTVEIEAVEGNQIHPWLPVTCIIKSESINLELQVFIATSLPTTPSSCSRQLISLSPLDKSSHFSAQGGMNEMGVWTPSYKCCLLMQSPLLRVELLPHCEPGWLVPVHLLPSLLLSLPLRHRPAWGSCSLTASGVMSTEVLPTEVRTN